MLNKIDISIFKKSTFRSKFALNAEDHRYIEKTGLEAIEKHAREFVVKRLASASPKNDVRQTPMQRHAVGSVYPNGMAYQ